MPTTHHARDTVELQRRETPPVHQFWHVVSQQSWSKSDRLPHLGQDVGGCESSTNPPRYGRVEAVACWDMGWISAQRGGRCDWSIAKKTWSVGPCRRWSLWSLNTCCDVSCLTFKLSYITTGCFQRHQHLKENNIPAVRTTRSAFHMVVWWHFICGGQVSSRDYSSFYCEITQTIRIRNTYW